MRGAKATLLGVIAACLFGWSVQAQTTDANVSPARLALAQKLVEVGKFDRAMTLAIDAVLRPFIQQINAGSAPPEMKTYTILLLKSETAEMEARITPKVAEIYAAEFTDQQLQDILAFYQSPTGQALVAKQPELSAAGQRAVAPLIPAMQADMVGKLFAHICETQHCTPAQKEKFDDAKAQLLAKFAAAQRAPAN